MKRQNKWKAVITAAAVAAAVSAPRARAGGSLEDAKNASGASFLEKNDADKGAGADLSGAVFAGGASRRDKGLKKDDHDRATSAAGPSAAAPSAAAPSAAVPAVTGPAAQRPKTAVPFPEGAAAPKCANGEKWTVGRVVNALAFGVWGL